MRTTLDSVLVVGDSMLVGFPCLSKELQFEGDVDSGVEILGRRPRK